MKQIVLILIGILFIKNLIAFDDYSTKSLSSSKHIIDSSTFYNGFETTTEELSQIYKTSTKNSNEEEFETQIYDEESDQYESDFCSIDSVIDYSIENLLPTDYEENKKLDPKRKIKHLNETIAIFRRLEEYSKNVSEIMKPIMKRVMPRITDILLMINLPPDCMASLARIGQSAREGETWALKFLDAMPSLPSRILEISSIPLGEYDDCLKIISPEEKDKPTIRGQYCRMSPMLPFPQKGYYKYGEPIDNSLMIIIENYVNSSKKKEKNEQRLNQTKEFINNLSQENFEELFEDLKFAFNLNFKISGLCLPTTCNPKDIQNAINELVYPLTLMQTIDIDSDCDYRDKPVKYDKHQIFAFITFAVLTVLVIMSTIVEFLQIEYQKTLRQNISDQLLRSFSLISNTKNVISTKAVSKKFSTVDGIRAIFAFYMFMIHVWYWPAASFLGTKGALTSAPYRALTEFKYVLLISINAQQVWFMIGGLMTAYIMFSRMERNKSKFGYFHYVIYRYLRTIFPLIGSILMLYLLPLTGDGPYWPMFMKLVTHGCYNNLNASLLMYSNYFSNNRQICNFPTWYTSAEFQAFIFAPIVFLIFYYKPKIGLILTPLLLIMGSFVALAPKIIFGIPHFFEYKEFRTPSEVTQSLRHHFLGIEQHTGSYILGILLGYLIKYKPNLYLGGRIGESFIWIITIVITFWGIIWNKDFMKFDYNLTQTELLFWIGLDKYMWTAFWFWVIYMGATGRGNFLNKFFEWKGFKVVSKLSLEIYLVHSFPIFYRISVARDLVHLSDYYLLTTALFDFIASCLLGFILNLLVTSPSAILINLLLLPQKRELYERKDENRFKTEIIDNNIDNNIIALKVINQENSFETQKKSIEIIKINDQINNSVNNDKNEKQIHL